MLPRGTILSGVGTARRAGSSGSRHRKTTGLGLALRRSGGTTIGRGQRLRILLILVAMGIRLALSPLAMVMSGLALAASPAAAGDRLTAAERAWLMKEASQARDQVPTGTRRP
jgi:hypothetical protein